METVDLLANVQLVGQVCKTFNSYYMLKFYHSNFVTGKICTEAAITNGASEPIDQCQGQPCHNGGTCESGSGWFRCVCDQGFSGPDCRINVNECSPQPCLGGATCIDGIGGFTCICPKGRRGSRCEIREFFIFISFAFVSAFY